MTSIRRFVLAVGLVGVLAVLYLALGAGAADAHAGPDDGAHHDGSTQLVRECAPDGRCSHGPDPAPPGVDPSVPVAPDEFAGASFAICDGNGTSGKRIQVLYVRATDRPDQFAQFENSFRGWAAEGDYIYQASAKRTGGTRYLRYVHDADCRVVVLHVTVTPAQDENFWTLTSALKAQGFNLDSRKYLVFLDSNHPTFCGQADVFADDRPTAGNLNNQQTGFAVIYNGCWNSQVTIAHEIGHNLGAVQRTSPNASRWDHCTDEWDVMCYDDGSGAGYELTFPCADQSGDELLDCNNDDYFSTAPMADTWLANHWNIADSGWLGAHDATLEFSIDEGDFNTPVSAVLRGFTPNQIVTVRWSDLTVMGQTTVDSSGNATLTFRIPLIRYETYILQARDTAGITATDKLKVIPRITFVDKSGYPGSETRVYLYGFGANDTVELRWSTDGGDNYEVFATVQTSANGRGTAIVRMPFSVEVGTHAIRAQSTLSIRRWATTTFDLLQTPWTIALSKTSSKYNGEVGFTLAGFSESSTVTIRWADQSVLATITSDGVGSGTGSFKTPLAPLGDFLVIATDNFGNAAVAKLRVVPRAMVNVGEVNPGDVVRVHYYGFAPGDQVETRFYSVDGASFAVLNTVTIAANGRGTELMTLPWDAEVGRHTIRGAAIGVARSTTISLVVDNPPWTITLDKEKSKYNGVVRLTLSGFAPYTEVAVTWPDGSLLDTVTTNGSGGATGSFRTPLAPLGDYVIRANSATGQTAFTELRIIPRAMLNENEAEPGDQMRVYFYGFEPGNQVEIRFQTVGSAYVVLGTVEIAANGRGSMVVTIPDDATTGPHTITGKALGVSRSTTTVLDVTGPGSATEPIPSPTATDSPTSEPTPAIEGTPIPGSPTPEPTTESPTVEPTIEAPTATPTPTPDVPPTDTPEPQIEPTPDPTYAPASGQGERIPQTRNKEFRSGSSSQGYFRFSWT